MGQQNVAFGKRAAGGTFSFPGVFFPRQSIPDLKLVTNILTHFNLSASGNSTLPLCIKLLLKTPVKKKKQTPWNNALWLLLFCGCVFSLDHQTFLEIENNNCIKHIVTSYITNDYQECFFFILFSLKIIYCKDGSSNF